MVKSLLFCDNALHQLVLCYHLTHSISWYYVTNTSGQNVSPVLTLEVAIIMVSQNTDHRIPVPIAQHIRRVQTSATLG